MKQFSTQGQHRTIATLYMFMRSVLLLFISMAFSIQDLSAQFPEDFEDAAFPPPGWTSYIGANGLGPNEGWTRIFHSGSFKASIDADGIADAEDWLVTPQFTPTAADHFISFTQLESFGNITTNVFTIRVSTASQTNHSDFTTILTYTELDIDFSVSFLEIDLSAYIDTPIHLAFVNDGGTERWLIDDIDLGPAATSANDECISAIMLPTNADLNCTSFESGTLLGATNSTDQNTCSFSMYSDVWYSFIATNSKHYIQVSNFSILNDCCSNLIGIQVLEGANCGNLTEVQCYESFASQNPFLGFNANSLTIGNTYYVRVAHKRPLPVSDSFDICIGTPPPPPANDECHNATTLTINTNQTCDYTASGTIASATASSPVGRLDNARGGGCPDFFDDDVWYKFVAGHSEVDIIFTNITGSTTDLQYGIMEGTACGSLSYVENLACYSIYSDIFRASGLGAGNTYYIRVSSSDLSEEHTTTFDVCIQSCGDSDLDYLTCDDLCPDISDVSLYFKNSGGGVGNPSDYVEIPHHTDFNLIDGDFAFEAWVYPTSGGYKTILSKGHGTSTATNYIFSIMADNDALYGQHGKLGLFLTDISEGETEWQFSNSSIPQNTWTHVAVSVDGFGFTPVVSFYVNGELDGVKTFSNLIQTEYLYNYDTNPLFIGRQGYSCQCHHFDGRIDELALWRKQLTSADVQASMAAPYNGNESGLVAYYDFNDAAACGMSLVSTTVIDKSNSHNGTLINFLGWSDPRDRCLSNWAPGHNRGACAAGCPPDLSLSGTQSSDLDHLSGSYINSNQHIDSPAQVNYDASTEISLLQSFEVKTGAVFHAYISGCSN